LTYNRKPLLRACLDALVNQSCREYEILVIDDGSTDGTEAFIAEYQKTLPRQLPFRYIQHPENRGVAVAHNTAIRHSAGDIIAVVADDCVPDKDWLAHAVRIHREHPEAGVVGGPVLNGYTKSVIANIGQQMVTDQVRRQVIDGLYTTYLVGNNATYKKCVVEEVGGFNETFRYGGEETELEERILRRGYRMIYSPDLKMTHFQRTTLRAFLRQYYAYGKGLYVNRSLIPPLSASGPKPASAWANLVRVLGWPGRVSGYLQRPIDKMFCYPLVYLGWITRAIGFTCAKVRAEFAQRQR
jgi:GT2 family glycosyltransferase